MSGSEIKETQDLVSIVVPAYNHENYIDRCIDSIMAQSYKNIELIIVNDGSSDNTAEKIKARSKECKNRFKRFVFIDKENEGQIKTFNRGCFEAKGEYLAVCASDDAYTPDAIETLHKFLSENKDYILAVGDNYIMDSSGKNCFWNIDQKNIYDENDAIYKTFGEMLKATIKSTDFYSEDFGSYKSLLGGNYIPNGYLFKRDIFIEKIGGYSQKAPLEDYYLHLQLSKFGKYKYIEKPLFYYRWHGENTSVVQKDKMEKTTRLTFLLERKYAYENGFKKSYDYYEMYSGKKTKKMGIPFLLELRTKYSPNGNRIKLKILGLTICEKIKTIDEKIIKILYVKIVKKKRTSAVISSQE